MYGTQTGFQQRPVHARNYSGPPPAKKAKGNPVITRYPPPPGYNGGYSGHARPYGTAPAPAWQPAAPGHGHVQTAWNGVTTQSYSGYQPYNTQAQSQWTGYPPQNPVNGYQPQNYQSHVTPSYPSSQSFWQSPVSVPTQSTSPSSSNPVDLQSSVESQKFERRDGSREISTSVLLLDGNGDPLSPSDDETQDDLDDDYFGECYFSRYPEEINPELSLGLIEWHPPIASKRALPATFNEAEIESIAPRKALPSDEESVSEYFIKSRREEALLSVRQTDLWDEVKDDMIFKELPPVCEMLLSFSDVLRKYKDRRDENWVAIERLGSLTPTLEPQASHAENSFDSDVVDGSDHEQSTAEHEPASLVNYRNSRVEPEHRSNKRRVRSGSNSAPHSRASSTSSLAGQRLTRPQPLPTVRDQQQEDILAALGVTGSPKMVYQTPGPAFGSASTRRASSTAPSSRQSSGNYDLDGSSNLPPPPPPEVPDYDPWNTDVGATGIHRERPNSSSSHRTAVGSDFHPDDQDATPKPNPNRPTDRRKRNFDDSDDNSHTQGWEDNDETPKQRRKQPRVDDVYGRRW